MKILAKRGICSVVDANPKASFPHNELIKSIFPHTSEWFAYVYFASLFEAQSLDIYINKHSFLNENMCKKVMAIHTLELIGLIWLPAS